MVSGYKTDEGYTAVAINTNDEATTVDLALDTSNTTNYLVGYLTDDTHKWAVQDTIQGIDNTFMITLPPKSVITFVGNIEK